MKRAIIVHCWAGHSGYAWYPWAKKQLESLGYTVSVPDMLDTENPKLENWLPQLQKLVGEPDENLLLIGHSIGSVAILRYLETLEANQKVNKAVLVAGFTDDLGFDKLTNFFKTPLDLAKIKIKSKNGFVIIQSDNDPYVPMRFAEQLRDELSAPLLVKHNALHMSGGGDGEAPCLELPEIVKAIKEEQ